MAAGARKSRNRPIKQKDIRIWMGAYRNIKSRATHKTKSPARRTDNERVNGGPAAMLAWISPKESFLSLTKISYSTALSFICRRVQRTWPQLPTGADLNPLRCRAKSGGDSCGYFRKASWPQKDSNSDEGLKKWVLLNIQLRPLRKHTFCPRSNSVNNCININYYLHFANSNDAWLLHCLWYVAKQFSQLHHPAFPFNPWTMHLHFLADFSLSR